MPMKQMEDLTFHIGKLTGAIESLNSNTKGNTAEIKVLNDYMHQNIGATQERDKNYKRMKHASFGSICIATASLIRAFIGHS